MKTEVNLLRWGFDACFASGLRDRDASLARVIAEYREAYRVVGARGESMARVTGKRMHEALGRKDFPAVGDWVEIEELGQDRSIIRAILPRRTLLQKSGGDGRGVRVIAANVDVAFIVSTLGRDYSLNRAERYLTLARSGGIRPVLVLNKADLAAPAELDARTAEARARFPGTELIPASAMTPEGLDGLLRAVRAGQTHCFLGSSGVGKSSLINRLLGSERIGTREVSRATGRGRHATVSRDMYLLPCGGLVIDNPGMREVGLAEAEEGLRDEFAEIGGLSAKCRYRDCTHTHEPGCAVLLALQEGRMGRARFDNYIKLRKENEHEGMTALEKRRKDRAFGKMVKKALAEACRSKRD